MENTPEIIDVQVQHVPHARLFTLTGDGSDTPVMSVPIEVFAVVQHLMREGYLVAAKSFKLTHDQHMPLTDIGRQIDGSD